jgi:hypothetical protein
MNPHRDPDLAIAAWLEEGPLQLPAEHRHAISTAARAIPQRRRGATLPGRLPTMNGNLRIAIAAAAVLTAAVGGAWLLAPRGDVPPDVASSPSPTVAPSPTTPFASPPPSLPVAGRVTLLPNGCTFEPSGVPLESAVTFELDNQTERLSGFDWFRLNPGSTFDQFMVHMEREIDLIERGEPYTGPPPGASLVTQAAVEPGQSRTQGVGFSSGTYVLVCVEGISETDNPIAYRVVGPFEAGPAPTWLGSLVLTQTLCRFERSEAPTGAADAAILDLDNQAPAKDGFFELYRITADRAEDFATYVAEEQRRAEAGEAQSGYPTWPLERWTRNVPGLSAASFGLGTLEPGTYAAACGTWDDEAKRILSIWPVEPFTVD